LEKTQIQNQKLKVLWWSNGFHTPTGYGVQSGNVIFRLKNLGYDMRCAANFGLQGCALDFNGVKQYPTTNISPYGEDSLQIVVNGWKPHVLVTLFDVWLGGFSSFFGEKDWLKKLHQRWIAWLPVDSDPITEAVADQAAKAYRAVAMSMFGQRELKRVGIPADYIPHGVECDVLKPAADKMVCRGWLDRHSVPVNPQVPVTVAPTDFVVGINKANKDRERADFDRMLLAFKLFLEDCPEAREDAKLYLHTWPKFPGASDVPSLCREYGLEPYVKVTRDYYMLCGLSNVDMSILYNGFDVFMNLARGEGFGAPILEAAACGVPSVATDFTAMTELVQGHGWLVKPVCTLRNGLNGSWAVPDEHQAAEALKEAYLHPKDRDRLGKLSREFALGCDFDGVVVPRWHELLSEVSSELGMFGTAQQKDEAFAALFKQAVSEVPKEVV
jgi:glycosyltransferase involved in cell wall biosynthesis